MSLESAMRGAVELLRESEVAKRYPLITFVTSDGVVEGPIDDSGRLPKNPDTGAGEEPGMLAIRMYSADAVEALRSTKGVNDVPTITYDEEEIAGLFDDVNEEDISAEEIAEMIADSSDFEVTTDDEDADAQDEMDVEDN